MEITLNITEDSKVELVKDNCEAVQGEHNVTILNINFPSTIKGYSIDNYKKQIEFGECKELGECKKFFDVLDGNTYKLCSICTQFTKLMVQFTLTNTIDEAEPIVWKSIPFALEFCESINAENTKEVQVALLSLAEILTEWENYIKNNTFRVVSKVEDMPTADATSIDKTIFYLGANSTSPYTLTYGHYYKCNYVNNAYEWTDLTQDPSIEGVANGIREINNNQTMQLWNGTKEELENEVTQPNVIYIPEDHSIDETFDEVLKAMKQDEEYLNNHLFLGIEKDSHGRLRIGDSIIPYKQDITPRVGSLFHPKIWQAFELPTHKSGLVGGYEGEYLEVFCYICHTDDYGQVVVDVEFNGKIKLGDEKNTYKPSISFCALDIVTSQETVGNYTIDKTWGTIKVFFDYDASSDNLSVYFDNYFNENQYKADISSYYLGIEKIYRVKE